VNQTEETTQINNTINLLSTKTEYSRYIIFEPIPGVHPTRFSEAEDALQDTKDRTKATGGGQRIKAVYPGRCLPPVTTPNSFSKPLCIAILETTMARYPESGSWHM
jgi:hypothetical protein